jgi:hypothetical protein
MGSCGTGGTGGGLAVEVVRGEIEVFREGRGIDYCQQPYGH